MTCRAEIGRKQWAGGAGWVAVAAGFFVGLGNAALLAQAPAQASVAQTSHAAQTTQAAKPAQAAQGIEGSWQGTAQVGQAMRIVVKIYKADNAAKNGGWKGALYSIDSGDAEAIPSITLRGADVRFALASGEASYEGKLSEDGASIAGTLTQDSRSYALNLVRVSDKDALAIPKQEMMMAKDADPDWEVATVKPGRLNDPNAGMRSDGRYVYIVSKTVESMLIVGYGMHKKQIVMNAPDWVTTELWDVMGVPDVPGNPSSKQFQSMIRKILTERFGLKEHTETRDLPVYALMVAKGGPKLTKSASDPNGPMNEEDLYNGGQRTIQMTNVAMPGFALDLGSYIDRPVVDQTGLAGRYDFTLKWAPDDSPTSDANALPGIFTAIQEQLGLKLVPTKAMVDVIVIDHVERPSAN